MSFRGDEMGKFDAQIMEGLRLLDEKRPGWEDAIVLDILDMRDGSFCVLGQISRRRLSGGSFWHEVADLLQVETPVADSLYSSREMQGVLERAASRGFAVDPFQSEDDIAEISAYGQLTREWKRVIMDRRRRRGQG